MSGDTKMGKSKGSVTQDLIMPLPNKIISVDKGPIFNQGLFKFDSIPVGEVQLTCCLSKSNFGLEVSEWA